MNKTELIYVDLSYKIIGAIYDVYNSLGAGHRESYYQKALAIAFKSNNIKLEEQVYAPLEYQGNKVGRYFLDFLLEDKIVLEIKKGSILHKKNIEQIYSYLKAKKLKLGILANFTRDGVRIKRIVNIK